MQGPTNYSHTLTAQVEQARRVKQRYPSMPTVVYMPGDGAQPMYDAELPLFDEFERFKGFFYLNADGEPLNVGYKCGTECPHPIFTRLTSTPECPLCTENVCVGAVSSPSPHLHPPH
jgi:hypothetical protein